MTRTPLFEAEHHVLIAEDSATQARHLQYILEGGGYGVRHASNGSLALELARRERPSLIISDVVMPEMTGYELCARIKDDPALSAVPVILVTTLSDPQDVIRGLECRADNFILKPYDPEQLLRRVQFVLLNNHMRRSEQPGMGLEITFGGQKHFITADRLQILNLLLSTYEAAIQRNKELSATRDTLRKTNDELQHLTHELEDRVLLRTRELEQSNDALRRAQQALIQQERLRALGQMASGIAHDINNAISPVALYTESLLEREPGLSERARTYLTTIHRAIDDVAGTVSRMREFYRQREPQLSLTKIDLSRTVQQAIELTHARWSDLPQRRGVMIELRTDLSAEPVEVMAVEGEVRDALTNLVFNAVDAMPKGGILTLRTGLAGNAEKMAERRPYVEVSDTGVGMDESTRRRCLEPFFTTKGERGSGLGLAMVYGMVQRHSAGLEIESEPDKGSTFRIAFSAETRSAPVPADDSPSRVVGRPLHVLLIDDDPLLLQSLRDILRADDHWVATAGGGQAGIDAFLASAERGEPFSAVITDLGMPHVDGRRVAAAIKERSPATPVILLTGWGNRLLAENDIPPHVDRVLNKPPRLREIRNALADLAGPGAPEAQP